MNYTEDMVKSIDEAMEDEVFSAKLKEAQSANEIKALFQEKGIEIDDEVAGGTYERLEFFRNGGELTAEEMEMVAGGKTKAVNKPGWVGYALTMGGAVAGAVVLKSPQGVVLGAAIGTAIWLAL